MPRGCVIDVKKAARGKRVMDSGDLRRNEFMHHKGGMTGLIEQGTPAPRCMYNLVSGFRPIAAGEIVVIVLHPTDTGSLVIAELITNRSGFPSVHRK